MFQSYTINRAPWGKRVVRILRSTLQAVEPASALRNHIHRNGEMLFVGGHNYELNSFNRVFVIGAGKAGVPMAQATADILGNRLTSGIVIVKEGYGVEFQNQLPAEIEILEAGHPIPDERGMKGAEKITDLISKCKETDLVLCLISGGGSALLVSPSPGISVDDLGRLTESLLRCGATINEINTLRKHVDSLKGGGLAYHAYPATLISLILSDVIGDPLDVIASGPTVPDTSTYQDAYRVLERYEIVTDVPRPIRLQLERGIKGDIPETPKAGDKIFERTKNIIIGSNYQAAQAAIRQSHVEGFNSLLLSTYLQGEASQVGLALAAIARQIARTGQPIKRPGCLVAGGETTVTLKGDGLGGRNQELALSAVPDLAGLQDVALVTLATDGGDGPTNAAGAIVTGETFDRALQAGMNPQEYLTGNDSYHFFETLGDLLKPGPTKTNVNDLTFIFAF